MATVNLINIADAGGGKAPLLKIVSMFGLFGGLADIRASIIDNAHTFRGDMRKRILAAAKEAGYVTIEYWHEHFAHKHFDARAVLDYPPYHKYYGKKRGNRRYITIARYAELMDQGYQHKRPLVDSGNLARRVVRTPLVRGATLTGTAQKTTIRIRYGRPESALNKADEEIKRLIETYGMSSRRAVKAVFSNMRVGYNAKIKARFEELIPFMNDAEKKQMISVYKAEFIKQLGSR